MNWFQISAVLIGSVAFLSSIVFTLMKIRKRRREIYKNEMYRSVKISELESTFQSALETILPQPTPPDDLVRDCYESKCVLYIGAGLSAQAGFPTWKPFVRDLLKWAIEKEIVEEEFGHALDAALETNETNLVADSILSEVESKNALDQLNEYLRQVFISSSRQPPKVHRLLKDINCNSILTTNFDNLLEDTFKKEGFSVYTPKDTQELMAALPNNEKIILKLYGSLDRPEMVSFAPAEYTAMIAGNKLFTEFMERLFNSRTLLFLGSSLEGIETYLEGIKFREYSSTPHYALVSVTGSAWKAKADLLLRRYGIVVLPYSPNQHHSEVSEFLKILVQKIREKKKEDVTIGSDDDGKSLKSKHIKRILLENMGPFEKLELKFDSHWNILLGNNGVGKSTILKAIAIGICGEEASPYADRLIKSGKNNAKIILETFDRTEYVIEIAKLESRTEITSITTKSLKTEKILALGFPPIRAVNWDKMRGPKQKEGIRRFTPDDLLPLIRGEYDPRMNELKQWIINIDYKIKHDQSKGIKKSKYTKLFKEFFRIVNKLTEGITIEFKEIDPLTNRVLILTDDGVVPLEAVSQGTTSIIGWVGILLQRMYEIYGDEDNPSEQFALVLIDEIDAHMHPGWQQSLISNLKDIFPNVQFIATTHSPLIVGGLEPHEVFRFHRDKNDSSHINIDIFEDKFAGWRADQLLTSSLFGLESSRDPATQSLVDQYTELVSQKKRSPQDEAELERISKELRVRIPTSEETKEAREASKLIQQSLKKEFESKPLAEREKILTEIDLQLQNTITGARDSDDS